MPDATPESTQAPVTQDQVQGAIDRMTDRRVIQPKEGDVAIEVLPTSFPIAGPPSDDATPPDADA